MLSRTRGSTGCSWPALCRDRNRLGTAHHHLPDGTRTRFWPARPTSRHLAVLEHAEPRRPASIALWSSGWPARSQTAGSGCYAGTPRRRWSGTSSSGSSWPSPSRTVSSAATAWSWSHTGSWQLFGEETVRCGCSKWTNEVNAKVVNEAGEQVRWTKMMNEDDCQPRSKAMIGELCLVEIRWDLVEMMRRGKRKISGHELNSNAISNVISNAVLNAILNTISNEKLIAKDTHARPYAWWRRGLWWERGGEGRIRLTASIRLSENQINRINQIQGIRMPNTFTNGSQKLTLLRDHDTLLEDVLVDLLAVFRWHQHGGFSWIGFVLRTESRSRIKTIRVLRCDG